MRYSALIVAVLLLSGPACADDPLARPAPEQPQAPPEELKVVAIRLVAVPAARTAQQLRGYLGTDKNVSIAYDPASNSVFIRANDRKIRQADDFIRALEEDDVYSAPSLYVIPLARLDAATAARVLCTLQALATVLGDYRTLHAAADRRTNRIILSGSRSRMQRTLEVLEWLDGPGK
jgi:type II secretory pathway component GspD/PulD (secretin)